MSDYKRFLSYIYAYDGDSKMNGCGFAKMEVREGRYRLAVNLNCVLSGQGKGYRVGVYDGSEERLEIVDIGGLEQANCGYVFNIMGSVSSFASERINIENAKGLVIYREAGSRIYITSWSDPFVVIRDLRECIHSGKNGLEMIKETENVQAEDNNKSDITIIYNNDTIKENTDDNRDTEEISNDREFRENDKDDVSAENSFIQSLVQLGRTVKNDEHIHADNKENELKAASNAFQEDISEIENEISRLNVVKEVQDKTAKSSDLWHEFKRMYPKIRPFSEEGWEVLQIKVQDIGRLSRENWILGNNNFVLHGYYRYGYLILARKHKAEMDVYVLGVPGTFSINEKFMASMFGMSEFMEADNKRPDLPKNFGYWCTHINM